MFQSKLSATAMHTGTIGIYDFTPLSETLTLRVGRQKI